MSDLLEKIKDVNKLVEGNLISESRGKYLIQELFNELNEESVNVTIRDEEKKQEEEEDDSDSEEEDDSCIYSFLKSILIKNKIKTQDDFKIYLKQRVENKRVKWKKIYNLVKNKYPESWKKLKEPEACVRGFVEPRVKGYKAFKEYAF